MRQAREQRLSITSVDGHVLVPIAGVVSVEVVVEDCPHWLRRERPVAAVENMAWLGETQERSQ
jgi:hypothetical protein